MKTILPSVIYDDRRNPDFIEEFAKQGISRYNVFPAITNRPTITACINASHQALVQQAMYRGDEYCIIMEDDVMFTKAGAWKRFIEEMPGDFDLWLGGCYSPVIDGYRTAVPVGFHCYAIREQYYEHFLSVDKDAHIDSMQQNGLYVVCYPMVALQRPGYSFNNRALVDYNEILKPEDVWR